MKRFLSSATFLLVAWFAALAAPISPQSALSRLDNSGNTFSFDAFAGTRAQKAPQLILSLDDANGEPALYVFDNNKSGFLILSADDAVTPLLGYSDSGSFDPDNIPPALSYWLSQYQSQIEFIRKYPLAETRAADSRAGISLPAWNPIQPLVTTKWNQSAPYNNDCPVYQNSTCVTGCVATAMAQAMKYFNYPTKGQGSVSYTSSAIKQNLSLDFSQVTFDWKNMLDIYSAGNYNSTQASAVATLMKAAGYGVQMNYTPNESGAASTMITGALVNYFNYDMGIRYFTRNMYTYTDWATMLYNNLKNYGPVIYDGEGTAGGHCWICDGYQGDGYFHFNWGWGGVSDGYYLLDALDPYTLGIGGGAGGFNFSQGAVFNMTPAKSGSSATPQSSIVLSGTIQGSLSSALLSFKAVGGSQPGWVYNGLSQLTFALGAGFVPVSNPDATPNYIPSENVANATLTGSTYIPGSTGVTINLNNAISKKYIEKGQQYKVISAYMTSDGVWHNVEAPMGNYNYTLVTYSTRGTFTVQNMAPLSFSASAISIESDLVCNSAVKVKATITNPNDSELSRSFALVLVNKLKSIIFTGEDVFLTLGPNGSIDQEWDTSLTGTSITKATSYYPALYDSESASLFYVSPDAVTMSPPAGTLSCTVNISIPDGVISSKYTSPTLYLVDSADPLKVLTDITVNSGYLADQLQLGLFVPTDGNSAIMSQSYPLGSGYIFLHQGNSETFTTQISYPLAKEDAFYYLGVLNSSNKLIGGNSLSVAFSVDTDGSGVESIEADSSKLLILFDKASASANIIGGENGVKSVEAFFLNGMKAPVKVEYNAGNAFVDLSGIGKGIIVLTATDGAGNRTSAKIPL